VTHREETSPLVDLSEETRETLLQSVRDAETAATDAEAAADRAREHSGQVIAELRRTHHISWPMLEKLTGVSKGTLIRRAQPYL
jgi:DNA-binding transcriptional regulator YiaG